MVNVRKRLEGTDNVLGAYTVENGMAIGCKKSKDTHLHSVVILKGNEDGSTNLYINMDKLEGLNCKVVFKNFEDELKPAGDRMNIRDCIKMKGWICHDGMLGRWQSVNVGFINSDGEEDETQFDIMHACTKDGVDELMDLFSAFCKENGYKTNTVQYVQVAKTAEIYDDLVD